MIRIGLTGSIASGKSAVSARLQELGAYLLDADAIAREVVAPGTAGLAAIAAEFEGVLTPCGALDRAALAAQVFADESKRERLNALLHPLILAQMCRRTAEIAEKEPSARVVWDAALLIECGWQGYVDVLWVVVAPDEVRLRRMMARDGCTEAHARLRMASQMPQEEKAAYADALLCNGGTLAELFERVDALYGALEHFADGGQQGE